MYQVAATTMKGTQYAVSIPEAGKTYKAEDWQQYMFVAAAWLFRATQNPTYLTVRCPGWGCLCIGDQSSLCARQLRQVSLSA